MYYNNLLIKVYIVDSRKEVLYVKNKTNFKKRKYITENTSDICEGGSWELQPSN